MRGKSHGILFEDKYTPPPPPPAGAHRCSRAWGPALTPRDRGLLLRRRSDAERLQPDAGTGARVVARDVGRAPARPPAAVLVLLLGAAWAGPVPAHRLLLLRRMRRWRGRLRLRCSRRGAGAIAKARARRLGQVCRTVGEAPGAGGRDRRRRARHAARRHRRQLGALPIQAAPPASRRTAPGLPGELLRSALRRPQRRGPPLLRDLLGAPRPPATAAAALRGACLPRRPMHVRAAASHRSRQRPEGDVRCRLAGGDVLLEAHAVVVLAEVVGEVQAGCVGGEVADDPHRLLRLVHVDVGAQQQRQRLQLQVARPLAVLGHALQVVAKRLIVLNEGLEVVRALPHVGHRAGAQFHVGLIFAIDLIRDGPKQAVAVAHGLLHPQPHRGQLLIEVVCRVVLGIPPLRLPLGLGGLRPALLALRPRLLSRLAPRRLQCVVTSHYWGTDPRRLSARTPESAPAAGVLLQKQGKAEGPLRRLAAAGGGQWLPEVSQSPPCCGTMSARTAA
mmetsp:Transcript_23366/g.59915  ORF Transcript_23366/g.59915 Transcript_23366/m.59915 type:complete len:504 (+) Transcript_23366:162-1673(+)